MNVTEAIQNRRTVRGFKPKPVADALIQEIFDAARQSPSNCNIQPWHVSVISGSAKEKLATELVAEVTSGKEPTPVFQPGDHNMQGVYRERQVACAFDYYGTMGIARSDKQARNELMLKNWQFFDAPHVAILSMPTSMGEVNAIDIGIYLQTLMLLMVERGLASCPQGALAFYPDPITAITNMPEENGILCGLSFGYEELGAQINEVKMPRATLSEIMEFIS